MMRKGFRNPINTFVDRCVGNNDHRANAPVAVNVASLYAPR